MLVVCRSEDRPTTSVVEEQSCGKAVRSSLGTDRLRGYREAVSFKLSYVNQANFRLYAVDPAKT